MTVLTIFELSSIFGGSLGSIENWLKPKTEPPSVVNFINIKRENFTYESLFWQLFLVTFWLWQKIRTKNAHL